MIRKVGLVVVGLMLFALAMTSWAGEGCSGCPGEKAAGCAEKASDTKATTTIADGNVYTLADGTKRFICPVMQSQMDVKDAPFHVDFEGKRYYLCCDGCPDKFKAEPKKFIDALAIPANIVKMADKKAVAVCPVTKEEVTVSRKAEHVDLNGKRYYFANKDAVAKFNAEPEKFIKAMEAPKDAGKKI